MLCHYTRQYVKEQFLIVELVGFEPTTPCLQSRCSSQLSYSPLQESCVGLGGVEPPTSRLSGVRSNHLSYSPLYVASMPTKRAGRQSQKNSVLFDGRNI